MAGFFKTDIIIKCQITVYYWMITCNYELLCFSWAKNERFISTYEAGRPLRAAMLCLHSNTGRTERWSVNPEENRRRRRKKRHGRNIIVDKHANKHIYYKNKWRESECKYLSTLWTRDSHRTCWYKLGEEALREGHSAALVNWTPHSGPQIFSNQQLWEQSHL